MGKRVIRDLDEIEISMLNLVWVFPLASNGRRLFSVPDSSPCTLAQAEKPAKWLVYNCKATSCVLELEEGRERVILRTEELTNEARQKS